MLGSLDSAEIEIPCTCGHKSKKTIGWIKSNSKFTCVCGINITLDADQFRREIDKVDDSLAGLQETIKRLGK